jgi:hypothetical protein
MHSTTAQPPPYTVVGGAASATSLQNKNGVGDAYSVAVLSARPDGPSLDLLSIILVMRQDSASLALRAREDLYRPRTRASRTSALSMGETGANVEVGSVRLPCVWHSNYAVFNATLFRLLCQSDDWIAKDAMRRTRLRMRLLVELPAFRVLAPFDTEALSMFPERGITGCVDFAYEDGDRPRDFNEWALAQQLVGVDRIYVADQLRYRDQVIDQVRRQFAVFTHDYPHRYVVQGARERVAPPTTYAMFFQSTSAYNWLCLHEHWYDDWVMASFSTDEFITFTGAVAPPTQREPLVGAAISNVWAKFGAPESTHRGGWTRRARHSFCTSILCLNRPFYAPNRLFVNESAAWTLPDLGKRLNYGSDRELAIERFTKRYRVMPPRGSVRKCFVHPDWRLGTRLKVHGFEMRGCPKGGKQGPPVVQCVRGWPGLRSTCLKQCGTWGNETAELHDACPGFSNTGLLLHGAEVAHFRVAPRENQVKGFDAKTWLPGLAGPIRERLAQCCPAHAG